MVKSSEKTPDTSQAERWVNENTFIYQGKLYQVNEDFTVVRVDKVADNSRAK